MREDGFITNSVLIISSSSITPTIAASTLRQFITNSVLKNHRHRQRLQSLQAHYANIGITVCRKRIGGHPGIRENCRSIAAKDPGQMQAKPHIEDASRFCTDAAGQLCRSAHRIEKPSVPCRVEATAEAFTSVAEDWVDAQPEVVKDPLAESLSMSALVRAIKQEHANKSDMVEQFPTKVSASESHLASVEKRLEA